MTDALFQSINITNFVPYGDGSVHARYPFGQPATDLSSIYFYENFSTAAIGSDPDALVGLSEVTPLSVISTEQSLESDRSYKDVSQNTGTTEWANGFVVAGAGDLVEGDEAWLRMSVFVPIGSDLTAPAEGGRLKWFRWRTEDGVGGNQGYSDIYYEQDIDEWRYIKESVNVWSVLSTGAPGGMEQGKWITWECYTKFHSTDGIMRYYKDGVLVAELLNEATLTLATDVVKSFYFRTYWNGGIPSQQDWYYGGIAMAVKGAGVDDSAHLIDDASGNPYIGMNT